MVSLDRGYGPSPEQFEELTNRTVTNTVEFLRQRARAQELLDTIVGPWPRFHLESTVSLTPTGANTATAPEFSASQSGYYNFLELRDVEGSGRGFRGYIADYNASTGVATVSGVAGSLSSVTATDTVIMRQVAKFPRPQDFGVTGLPTVPEDITLAIAYMIEYWVSLEKQDGFNSPELNNLQSDVVQEGIGEVTASYRADRSQTKQLIGPKAYEILRNGGYLRAHARLVRYPTGPGTW